MIRIGKMTMILLMMLTVSNALDNGLFQTPPMGWLSWARFRCIVDCDKYPTDCISARLYMEMADELVRGGWKDAGYEYVNIDDCWQESNRDPRTNRLVPDRKRFPNGMRALGQYIHSKGLKFGLYSDVGTATCESKCV